MLQIPIWTEIWNENWAFQSRRSMCQIVSQAHRPYLANCQRNTCLAVRIEAAAGIRVFKVRCWAYSRYDSLLGSVVVGGSEHPHQIYSPGFPWYALKPDWKPEIWWRVLQPIMPGIQIVKAGTSVIKKAQGGSRTPTNKSGEPSIQGQGQVIAVLAANGTKICYTAPAGRAHSVMIEC